MYVNCNLVHGGGMGLLNLFYLLRHPWLCHMVNQ